MYWPITPPPSGGMTVEVTLLEITDEPIVECVSSSTIYTTVGPVTLKISLYHISGVVEKTMMQAQTLYSSLLLKAVLVETDELE